MTRIYLDFNASAPLEPAAAAAIEAAMAAGPGNPSSIHEEGRAARDLLERARRQVGGLIGAGPDDLVFTSGGTEADSLAVIGLAERARAAGAPGKILTSGLEHPAVSGAVDRLAQAGFEVVRLAVSSEGLLDVSVAEGALLDGAALITVQLANHEVGTVQPVVRVTELARAAGVRVHCDAVQAAGRIAIDVGELGVDSLAISGHKLGAPAGIGALWMKPELGRDAVPLLAGGHQERGRRPGTENLLGAIGRGAAAEVAADRVACGGVAATELAERLERGLRAIDGVRVHGAGAPRVGNTVNAGFAGALGEIVVAGLDLEGIAVSTGAACTSGRVEASPVLLAMGFGEKEAREAVRFSLGWTTTAEEIDRVLEVLPAIVARTRTFG